MGVSQLLVMRTPSIRLCRLATLLVAAAASGFYLGCYWTMGHYTICDSLEACDPRTSDIDFLREIARLLNEAVLELKGCSCATRTLLAMQGVMARLDTRHAISADKILLYTQHQQVAATASTKAAELEAASRSADACWEMYTGGRPDQEGFKPASDCRQEDKPPLEALVTAVLLASPASPLPRALDSPLEALRVKHPRLRAVVAAEAADVASGAASRRASSHNLTMVERARAQDFATAGALLNRLVRNVSSPYALLVRDAVRVDEAARLERLVYVISALRGKGGARGRQNRTGGIRGKKAPPAGSEPSSSNATEAWGLAVAGGAVRDAKGRWSAGCIETSLRNYALSMKRGYRYSVLDCMLCDQLRGPFLARTSLLLEVPFREDLPASVVFEDWFLRVKRRGALVAGCPDSLFYVSGAAEGEGHKEDGAVEGPEWRRAWGQLATAWQVDRVLLPGRPALRFSCSEVNLHCDLRTLQNKSLLIPVCCLHQMAEALKAFDSFASRHHFDYELNEGTTLGAVKLQSVLPWDIDGDILIKCEDFEKYREAKHEMSALGYSFDHFTKKDTYKYFDFFTPNITIDMWCRQVLGTLMLPKEMQHVPTRIKMMGIWMRGPWNPGLVARNRYGPGYLQHAQHWKIMGLSNHWGAYLVGGWTNCALPNHHACLNRYPTDGSFNLLPEYYP